MANITAARIVNERPRTELIPYIGMDGQDYFRGGAACIRTSGAEAGRIDRTMDGTVHAVFGGLVEETVLPRDSASAFLTQAQLNARKDLEIKLKSDGTATFVCSGFDATNFVAEIGRLVWFTDDQTVSLTPPSVDYPLCAGRVIDIISATSCEVDITQGVHKATQWQELVVGPTPLAGIAAAVDIEALTDYPFDRRIFVHEISVVVNVAVAGFAVDQIYYGVDAADTQIAGMSVPTTDAVGAVTTGAVNVLVLDTETFTVKLGSTGETTAGELTVIVRYLNAD